MESVYGNTKKVLTIVLLLSVGFMFTFENVYSANRGGGFSIKKQPSLSSTNTIPHIKTSSIVAKTAGAAGRLPKKISSTKITSGISAKRALSRVKISNIVNRTVGSVNRLPRKISGSIIKSGLEPKRGDFIDTGGPIIYQPEPSTILIGSVVASNLVPVRPFRPCIVAKGCGDGSSSGSSGGSGGSGNGSTTFVPLQADIFELTGDDKGEKFVGIMSAAAEAFLKDNYEGKDDKDLSLAANKPVEKSKIETDQELSRLASASGKQKDEIVDAHDLANLAPASGKMVMDKKPIGKNADNLQSNAEDLAKLEPAASAEAIEFNRNNSPNVISGMDYLRSSILK